MVDPFGDGPVQQPAMNEIAERGGGGAFSRGGAAKMAIIAEAGIDRT